MLLLFLTQFHLNEKFLCRHDLIAVLLLLLYFRVTLQAVKRENPCFTFHPEDEKEELGKSHKKKYWSFV